MENVEKRCKRKHINWVILMLKTKNPDIEHEYILQLGRLYRGKHFSFNRCAYYALKKYYSTTTIDELLTKIDVDILKVCGVSSVVLGDKKYEL